MGVTSLMTMAEWLASSHPEPKRVWTEWTDHGVAVIPTGHQFTAVRMPEALVHAATESDDPDEVAFVLATHLDGPVIHDGRGRNYYALVRPEGADGWDVTSPGVEFLAPRTHLGVPAQTRCEYTPATPIYWAVPGTAPSYCDAGSVAILAHVGAARLSEATP